MSSETFCVTPEVFWDKYLAELRSCRQWSDYKDNKKWTNFALTTGQKICKSLGLETSKEYFRIDVIGYVNIEPYHNWSLKVAFEHENRRQSWPSELCKLAHIIADLRVIVYYHDYKKNPDPALYLKNYIDKVKDRVLRYSPELQWLFICGPTNKFLKNRPFIAFKLSENGVPLMLESSRGDFIASLEKPYK